MFGSLDWPALILLACLCVVVFQLVRWIWRRRVGGDDPWLRLSYKEQIRALSECTPLGRREMDGDGIIRRVNRRECEILDLPASRLVGRPCWELAPEADRKRLREEYFRKLSGNVPLLKVHRKHQRPDGSVLTLETYESLLRDDSGRVVGMSVGSLDITERRNKEDEVFQTTSELRALFQAFPDLFLRLDTEGVILDVKAGQSAVSLAPSKDLVGKRLHDVLPGDAGALIKAAIAKLRKTNLMVVVEYEVPGSPEPQHCEARFLPLPWGQTIVVLRDITERRKDQAKLEEYAQELEQNNQEMEEALYKAKEATKLKSRFLANMSHEIRTPMNGVIGMTDFLLATPLNLEQREFTESLKSSANSLMAVVNDILDISKIEAGKMQVESVPFDLAGTIQEVVSVFSLRARAQHLFFRCEEIPKLDCMAKGDPGRLRQVLNNLLGNAIKFTHKGGVTLRNELLSQTPDSLTLRFTVEDTGIGISAEQRRRLFQNFVQGDDSTTRKYGGTGLGLAISKQLVELMGGQIGVSSKLDSGSRFWFTAAFGKHYVEQQPNLGESVSLDGLRVLVVDRENSAGLIAEQHLPSLGCRSEVVHHGQQAVPTLQEAAATGSPFRAALIDLQVAERDGLNPAVGIKSDPLISHTLLIAMTSMPMRGDGLAVRQKGYAGYFVKPVQASVLGGIITEVLQSDGKPDAPLVTRHTISEQQGRSRQAVAEEAGGSQPEDSAPRAKPRALVAEDNPINQKIALRLLQKVGLDVDVVSNGREAVDAFAQTTYDLILMDCQMPEMDGFEATAEIRRLEGDSRHTPICAVTAHAMTSDREKCLAAGMDDYLSKPVDVRRLREAVNRLIGSDSLDGDEPRHKTAAAACRQGS